MEKMFYGSSIKECIELACKELNMDKDKILYRIVEEKKGLLRRSVAIAVDIPVTPTDSTQLIAPDEDDGTITLTEGKLYVTNPKNEGRPAEIITSSSMVLKVNDEIIADRTFVYESDKIEYSFEESSASRKMNISISPDKLEAYVTIKYTPKYVYGLVDFEKKNKAFLEGRIIDKVYPPVYLDNEIRQELFLLDVKFGIIGDNILKCANKDGVENLLIAKGQLAIDDEGDSIELKFTTDKDMSNLTNDDKTNIDYKSIGAIEAINRGEVLAIKHNGKSGKDGIDITGKIYKHKSAKKIHLKAGTGCILKGDNTVIAEIQGKPCIKNNVFYVYPVHELNNDVDIKSGNIKFVGDVIVHGNVTEGMAVESGNFVEIHGNVLRASVKAKGNIDIKGNVSNSDVFAGGEDVSKLNQIQNLNNFHEYLSGLIKTVEEVKKFNLLGYNTHDGEIIKVLIENKFKKFPQLCLSYITSHCIENGNEEDGIISFIRNKLVGLAPLNIKHYSELNEFAELLISKSESLKNSLSIPVSIKVGYCQESNVSSSGDILVAGKGALTCHISANNMINFISDNSVVRGCIISANKEIKCKTVGSSAGVSTKLVVKHEGHIYAEIAYQNTTFVVGNREVTIDVPSKNIHAYLNDASELVIDKLKL